MKDIRERINDLTDEDATRLAIALDSFKCTSPNYPYCDGCPLCNSDGSCLTILLITRVKRGKC